MHEELALNGPFGSFINKLVYTFWSFLGSFFSMEIWSTGVWIDFQIPNKYPEHTDKCVCVTNRCKSDAHTGKNAETALDM